jgi:hypothetical protein
MGSASDYLENALLDHVFENSAYTQPTIYIGASTADPTDDASGLAEPSGNGYARKAHSTWDTAASGATENTGAITFAVSTGSWGTITHWAAFDALSGGNMLCHGALGSSQAIANNEILEFADGAIDITLT